MAGKSDVLGVGDSDILCGRKYYLDPGHPHQYFDHFIKPSSNLHVYSGAIPDLLEMLNGLVLWRRLLLLNRWPFFYSYLISVISECCLFCCCAGEVTLQSTQNSLFVSDFTENQQHLGKAGQPRYSLIGLSEEVRSR